VIGTGIEEVCIVVSKEDRSRLDELLSRPCTVEQLHALSQDSGGSAL
jgi:hypothetical protein